MARPTDYLAAATRWRADLDAFTRGPSVEGSDHIVGLAAECACKALLVALGAAVTVTDGGFREGRHRVHLPYVLDELMCHAAGRGGAALLACLPAVNAFRDWSIDDRYVADDLLDADALRRHRAALDQIFQALQAAALDGVLA